MGTAIDLLFVVYVGVDAGRQRPAGQPGQQVVGRELGHGDPGFGGGAADVRRDQQVGLLQQGMVARQRFGVGDITGKGSIEFWTQAKKITTRW